MSVPYQQNPSKVYKISNFINDIIEKKIVQFGKTELSCGRTSSYYADFRQLLGYPALTNYIVSQMTKAIDTGVATGTNYDKIVGVAQAGIPWATLVGNKLEKPVSIVRQSEKAHGKKTSIDGAPVNFDENVILIEDVLTTGKSVINAIRKLNNAGANVIRVICILDRNEGASEHINYYFPDIKITSILTIGTLISVCTANKLIDDYAAEQVEFYRELGYTETIKMLTKLNDDAKDKEYQLNPVKWHIDNYSDVWNLYKGENTVTNINNPMFVDVSNMMDWQEIKYKIQAIGNRLRTLVIKFENIDNWDAKKQQELLELHNKYDFNVLYRSNECIPQSHVVNMSKYTLYNVLNVVSQGCKYPNSVLTNGLILNLYINNNCQANIISQLQESLKVYELCNDFHLMQTPNIYLNLVGPGVSEIIPNVELWTEFRNYILSIMNNQILQIKGLIFSYSQLKRSPGIYLPRKLGLNRLIPLILDTSEIMEFHLDPSMLTDRPTTDYIESLYNITKVFNGNMFTHMIVGSDLMQSNMIIETRIAQYIKFVTETVYKDQKNPFGLLQITEYAANNKSENIGAKQIDGETVMKVDNPSIAVKVNDFIEKEKAQAQELEKEKERELSTMVQSGVKPTSPGLINVCKGYLINGLNRVLVYVGMSVTAL